MVFGNGEKFIGEFNEGFLNVFYDFLKVNELVQGHIILKMGKNSWGDGKLIKKFGV